MPGWPTFEWPTFEWPTFEWPTFEWRMFDTIRQVIESGPVPVRVTIDG